MVAHDGLRQVVLGHLSRDCNEPEVAVTAVRGALDAGGWPRVEGGVRVPGRADRVVPVPGRAAAGGGVQGELF